MGIVVAPKNHLVAEMNPLRNWIVKKRFVIAVRVLGILSLFNLFVLMSVFFIERAEF